MQAPKGVVKDKVSADEEICSDQASLSGCCTERPCFNGLYLFDCKARSESDSCLSSYESEHIVLS